MAHKVEQFPAAPERSKYPWAEWLDGGIWELTQGHDFDGQTHAFRSNARAQAKKRGGKLRARTLKKKGEPERLYIQFIRKE
jgi:hypothetical protein